MSTKWAEFGIAGMVGYARGYGSILAETVEEPPITLSRRLPASSRVLSTGTSA